MTGLGVHRCVCVPFFCCCCNLANLGSDLHQIIAVDVFCMLKTISFDANLTTPTRCILTSSIIGPALPHDMDGMNRKREEL